MTNEGHKESSNLFEFYGTIFFAILLFLITFFIVVKQMTFPSVIDYQAHARSALALTFQNYFSTFLSSPYLMWHTLVKICSEILGDDKAIYGAAIITGGFITATYIIVSRFMRRFGNNGACIMAFASCVIGPLYMPWINTNYYKGQGTPNTWHNPTNIAVKPFAALTLIYLLKIIAKIKKGENIQIKEMITLACFVFLGVFAKPSFAMSFIPALGIWIIISCVVEKFKNLKSYIVLCALFLPGVLLIGFQYMSFFGESTEAGIGIDLFRAVRYHTAHPLLSTLLTIAFPLLFLILNIKKEWKRYDTQIVTINATIGWLVQSFLYETGSREKHGNFGWAYLMSLFLLYFVTMGHFWEDLRTNTDNTKSMIKNGILFGLMCLQILFGIIYIYRLLIVQGVWL